MGYFTTYLIQAPTPPSLGHSLLLGTLTLQYAKMVNMPSATPVLTPDHLERGYYDASRVDAWLKDNHMEGLFGPVSVYDIGWDRATGFHVQHILPVQHSPHVQHTFPVQHPSA